MAPLSSLLLLLVADDPLVYASQLLGFLLLLFLLPPYGPDACLVAVYVPAADGLPEAVPLAPELDI